MRFRMGALAALALGLAMLPRPVSAQETAFNPALPLVHVDHGANSAAAEHQHYLVLVSLDGFRWDYAVRDKAQNLLALGKQGVWASQGMLPSFPSLTFPNHFTIVTGLYPEHHGLVANSFWDQTRQARYAIADAKAVGDGTWYTGVPIWSLAESQGMRTAVLLWPGSEATIASFQPTWYARFDNKTETSDQSQQARIDNTVALLKLPPATRPHFIAIYYSEPDHEGHSFGPDAFETRAAELKMDDLIGKLKAALDSTGLPIDLVVVSDHGMVAEQGSWVTLDQFADLTGFETAGGLLYGKTEADRTSVYRQLKDKSDKFIVYRRQDVPSALNFNQNPREGDPVVIATGPYAIRAHGPSAGKEDRPPTAGMHGFDPRKMPEMKASFFAAGPDLVSGKTIVPFENVNLYPWMAHILGLTPPSNDGSLKVLADTLRDHGMAVAKKGAR